MHPASFYEYRAMLRMAGPDCACILHPVSRLLARCKYGTHAVHLFLAAAYTRSPEVFRSLIFFFLCL